VATIVAWNSFTTQSCAEQYSGGSGSLQPYLRCKRAPLHLNSLQDRTEFGDKKHWPVDEWLLYQEDTHSLKLEVMPVGVSEGWIGTEAHCIIAAYAVTDGEKSMGTTPQANASNTVRLDMSDGTPRIQWVSAEDEDTTLLPTDPPVPKFMFGGTWHYRYANCHVRIDYGKVKSVWSEWTDWIEPNDSAPPPYWRWMRITNNYPVEDLYWEFEIVWR
jgi:hypothetical protein